jgi:integrase
VVADRAARPARGEAAALDRDDLDSEARELTVSRQLVALPGELYWGPPKSRASIRTIALDEAGTRRLVHQAVQQGIDLMEHRFTDQRRRHARTRTGPGWRQGRPMFTYADGRSIRPEYLTHRFRRLCTELGLPPIRLHDLRHGAATLAEMSGVASGASFGGSRERRGPGLRGQRVAGGDGVGAGRHAA